MQNIRVEDAEDKNIVIGGDFKIFFHLILEAQRSSHIIKNKSVVKLIQRKENLHLIHIWGIRDQKQIRFMF